MNSAICMPLKPPSSKIIKQLLYRCWHRGMKEVDLILGPFLEIHKNQLSSEECKTLNHLLDCDDQDLLDWILRKKAIPKLYAADVIVKIQNFASSLPSVSGEKFILQEIKQQ
ncbi:MAG: succinate dehydrogenase assembly factor 2 [Alphaproteobacteria bacterium]|nr:succinate dehydrogenase assembly factor 2 [Alphaproteobacteria bacterium]